MKKNYTYPKIEVLHLTEPLMFTVHESGGENPENGRAPKRTEPF